MTPSGAGCSALTDTRGLSPLASSTPWTRYRNNVGVNCRSWPTAGATCKLQTNLCYLDTCITEHMNLGSAGSVSVTSGGSAAPPPPPPLSSSGGGSGPSSLSPGTSGGYQPQPPSLASHPQHSGEQTSCPPYHNVLAFQVLAAPLQV